MTHLLVRARLARTTARCAGVRIVGRRRPDRRRRAGADAGRPATPGWPASCCPGFANAHSHAFHRALRGRTHDRRRHVLDLAGADVRRRRPARPGQLPRAGPGGLRRDGAGRGHLRRASSTTCTTRPAAAATPTRTRWARRWSRPRPTPASGSPCSTPATSPAASTARGHLPLDDVQRRFGDGDADAWAARVAAPARARRACGSARRCTRCGRSRPSSCRRRRGRRRPPAARAPLRAAGRERGLPGRSTAARPTAAARRRRRCSARTPPPCTPPTSPTTTSPTLGGSRHGGLRLPDHRGRPGRRHRARSAGSGTPGRRSAWAATARGDRPARGGAALERTSGWSPASAAASGRPSWSTALTVAGHRALGWPDAGRHRARAAGRPGRRPRWTARAPPAARPTSCVMAATAADVHTVVVDGRVVVADGRHVLGDVGRLLADAIAAAVGGRMSTLVTGIGELVTNDPARATAAGLVADAALVVERRRASPGSGPPRDAPGRRRADRRRRPGGHPRLRRQPRPPGLRRRPGGRVRGADGRRAATTAAASRTTVAATRAATDDELRARLRGAGRRDARAGHHDRRDQERLRPDRRRRGPRAAAGRGGHRRRPPSSARTSCRPGTPTARTTTSTWSPARCSPPARRTPGGSTCSASRRRRRVRRRRGPRGAGRPAGPPGWACGCTPTSSRPGPGVQLAVELGAASADHCTHLTDADVDALAGGTTVATLLPGVEFSTRSPYPDARRLLDAGVTVALATDCNPGSCFTSSMPFCIALAVREMRMTPAEALWAATAGGAAALRRDDVGHLGVGRAGRPRRPRRAVLPAPGLPARRAARARPGAAGPGSPARPQLGPAGPRGADGSQGPRSDCSRPSASCSRHETPHLGRAHRLQALPGELGTAPHVQLPDRRLDRRHRRRGHAELGHPESEQEGDGLRVGRHLAADRDGRPPGRPAPDLGDQPQHRRIERVGQGAPPRGSPARRPACTASGRWSRCSRSRRAAGTPRCSAAAAGTSTIIPTRSDGGRPSSPAASSSRRRAASSSSTVVTIGNMTLTGADRATRQIAASCSLSSSGRARESRRPRRPRNGLASRSCGR